MQYFFILIGSTEEQLKEMATPENFEKYTKISKAQAEKTVSYSLFFSNLLYVFSCKVLTWSDIIMFFYWIGYIEYGISRNRRERKNYCYTRRN